MSLGTAGETVHKATLRFIGCLIGAALGVGAILVVIPFMTNLGEMGGHVQPVGHQRNRAEQQGRR